MNNENEIVVKSISITNSLYKWLLLLAKKETRSVSGQIRVILSNAKNEMESKMEKETGCE